MKTTTYTLPAYWASYLVNGDATGLSDGEEAQCDAWLTAHAEAGQCVDVGEETWFAHSCDVRGAFAGDVATFTFYNHEAVSSS